MNIRYFLINFTRLRSLQYLNYNQIEVRVMTVQDALHQLKLEISENENRKDFSFSEKMKWAEGLKKEYSKIVEQNSMSDLKNSEF
jgi:ParB family chromosome partitioning protein